MPASYLYHATHPAVPRLPCPGLGPAQIAKLPAVWRLTGLLLTYRLGVLAAEGAVQMKLIDKGVAKETLAFMVLFQVGAFHA